MATASQGDEAQPSTPNSESGLRLKITRVGGLLPIQRTLEVNFNSLNDGERAALQALFSMKPQDAGEKPAPDATSYKFELDGPTKHLSVTIKGMLIPSLLRRLLP
jgi:hypothetical protein